MNNTTPPVTHPPAIPQRTNRHLIPQTTYYTDNQIQQLIADEIIHTMFPISPLFNTTMETPNTYQPTQHQRQHRGQRYSQEQREPINEHDNFFSIIYSLRQHMNAYNENTRIYLETMNCIQNNLYNLQRENNRDHRRGFYQQYSHQQQPQHQQSHHPQPQQPQEQTNRHPNRNAYRSDYRQNIPFVAPRQPRRTFNPLFNAISTLFETYDPINLQDVIVRPTDEQLSRALLFINYETGVENNMSRCPITMEPFEDGEQICQIVHCGHCFSEAAIRNWFQSHVHCPVCRRDVREIPTAPGPIHAQTTSPGDASHNQTTFDDETSDDNPPPQSNERRSGYYTPTISRIINDIIGQNMSNAMDRDNSSNYTYTFQFPVIYYDGSFNYYNDTSEMEMVD